MTEHNTPATPWTPDWLKKASPFVVAAMDEHRERSEAPRPVPHEVTR